MQLSVTPEQYEVIEAYFKNAQDSKATAEYLNIPVAQVTEVLAKKEVQNYVSRIFLESGWANKDKLVTLLGTIVDQKIEQATEAEMPFSGKDILDVVEMLRKIRADEMKYQLELAKLNSPSTQVNIQNNIGYSSLLEKLLKE